MSSPHTVDSRRLLALAAAALAFAAGAARSEPLDEALYAEILTEYTREVPDPAGVRVDYRALELGGEWPRLLTNLARTRPDALQSREERLSFWINAYNILAIQVVLDHYPIDGIREAGNLIRPVWKRNAGIVGGRNVSLGWIEHEVLRPMGDPRIHAAIVCASVSCPPLRREPFSAERIDEQLDDALAGLLADPGKGLRIDRDRGELLLSRIFKWFRDDFDDRGGVLAVAARHGPPEARRWLELNPEPRIAYLDYDWGLNDLARAPGPTGLVTEPEGPAARRPSPDASDRPSGS